MGNVWAIVFPHNTYMWPTLKKKEKYGTNVDMIWERIWPIFGLGAGARYCPYTALMWAVWTVYCQYTADTAANIWAIKSFLGGNHTKTLSTHSKNVFVQII